MIHQLEFIWIYDSMAYMYPMIAKKHMKPVPDKLLDKSSQSLVSGSSLL